MRASSMFALCVIHCSCTSGTTSWDPLEPSGGTTSAGTGGSQVTTGGTAAASAGLSARGEGAAAGAGGGSGGSPGSSGDASGGIGGEPETPGGTTSAGAGPELSPAQWLGGLGEWYLTLPVGESTSADKVEQPELATYSDPYFEMAPGGRSVRMTALFGGARTSISTPYARSELRHLYDGPDALDNQTWPCAESAHTMNIEQAITKTPLRKPEMSIGQIRDADNELLEIRYAGPKDEDGIGIGDGLTDEGRIEVHFNNDTSSEVLDANYRIGDVMMLTMATDGAGNMQVRYQNRARGVKRVASTAIYSDVSGGCYFRAGNHHRACSKKDINGNVNQECVGKDWAPGRYEVDPQGTSVLELVALEVK